MDTTHPGISVSKKLKCLPLEAIQKIQIYLHFGARYLNFGAKFLNYGAKISKTSLWIGRVGVWVGPPGPGGTFRHQCGQKKFCLPLEAILALFVLFVWGKTRKSILRSLLPIVRERMEVITPGSGQRLNQPGLELYPRLSCFQHDNRPENTPRHTCVTQRTLWCWFNQTRTTCKNRWTLWRRFNQTRTTCINQWLTLYKLTGWLASLDLRKSNLAIQNTSSNTKITIPYTFTFCCRGFVCFFVCLFG